jgi:hypothetical protein
MKKWLISVFLLAVVLGGTTTGMPRHAGEKGCPLAAMMDCCAEARMKSDKPETLAARICCALNCSEPGTTQPSGCFRISPQPIVKLEVIPVSRLAPDHGRGLTRSFSPPGYRRNLDPAYIRHLALLI